MPPADRHTETGALRGNRVPVQRLYPNINWLVRIFAFVPAQASYYSGRPKSGEPSGRQVKGLARICRAQPAPLLRAAW